MKNFSTEGPNVRLPMFLESSYLLFPFFNLILLAGKKEGRTLEVRERLHVLGLRGNFTRQVSLDKPVTRVPGSPTVQPKCSDSVSLHILKPFILISLLYTDRRNSANYIFCKVLTRKRKKGDSFL